MSASDAKPIPIKGSAYRVYFPIYKNDGTVITGWAGAAATISKDGATSTSASGTPTEIASSWGIGYLDLTSSEMNVDCLLIKVTVTNTSALPQILALYPQEAGDILATIEALNADTVDATALAADAAAEVAAAVSDELLSSHTTPGSLAQSITDIRSKALLITAENVSFHRADRPDHRRSDAGARRRLHRQQWADAAAVVERRLDALQPDQRRQPQL